MTNKKNLGTETTTDAFRWRTLMADTYEGDGWRMLVCEGLVLGAVADFRGLAQQGVIYRRPTGELRSIGKGLWGNVPHYRSNGKVYQEVKKYLGYSTPEEVRTLIYFIMEWLPRMVELAHLELDAEELQARLLAEVPIRAVPKLQGCQQQQRRQVTGRRAADRAR